MPGRTDVRVHAFLNLHGRHGAHSFTTELGGPEQVVEANLQLNLVRQRLLPVPTDVDSRT